ncbi:hypothetical protein HNQ59_002722 [Chitinivorax tropicus]|uniref:Tle cognate immunity protein 4 C-terminal domain-containing protein n=2 Tax=Chitinivorax tropicus TaxID=714531 RepID=A0A840MLY3_9PROT|nr:hypothetical protein [Chitinivorax tropicus]
MEKQTVCLGRYLIDLPKEINLVGNWAEKFAGYKLETNIKTRQQFDSDLNDMRKNLDQSPHRKDPSRLKLFNETKSGNIVAYWEHDFSNVAYILEGHAWHEGVHYKLSTYASRSRFENTVNELRKVLPKIEYRAEHELPAKDGLCIRHGLVAGQFEKNEGVEIQESIKARFQLKHHPDFYLSLSSDSNYSKLEEGLLARWSKAQGSLLGMFASLATGVSTLRKGEHPVSELPGEEVLITAPGERGGRFQQFTWETPGKPESVMYPQIQISLESGFNPANTGPSKIQSSLSDEAAMKLFDEIVGSLRLRPVTAAGTKQQSDAADLFPIDTLVASGQPCPRTGTWRCSERNEDVEGGHNRVFEQGELLPAVILLGKPNLFGKRPVQTNWPTVWRLVSAPEDSQPE